MKSKLFAKTVLLLLLFSGGVLSAQEVSPTDTTVQNDTIKETRKKKVVEDVETDKETTVVKRHSPKKAAIYSGVLPGLGQIYNRKYWKLPIVYGGFTGLTIGLININSNYQTYRTALRLRLDGNPDTVDEFDGQLSDQNLRTLKNFYKRNLDLIVIGFIGLYAINIIDATVDAHLFDFDVSDDLSFHIRPDIGIVPGTMAFYPSLRFIIRM